MLKAMQLSEGRGSTSSCHPGPGLHRPRSPDTPVPLCFRAFPGRGGGRGGESVYATTLGSHQGHFKVSHNPPTWKVFLADVRGSSPLVVLRSS